MTILFPDISQNQNTVFNLNFKGMLPRDRDLVYKPELLVFRDRTDNTTISIANTGEGFLQATPGETLYSGNGGYLTTTYHSGLSFGTNPYTIELLLSLPTFRTDAVAGLIAVAEAASGNNWQLIVDSLNRPVFTHGTTSEVASAAMAIDAVVHIAIVRSSTATNDTVMYLDGVAVKTFTDDVDYTYTAGLNIGAARDNANPLIQGYINDIRLSSEARYTAEFTPPTKFQYVAMGDLFQYQNRIYGWDGLKWRNRDRFVPTVVGEYRNYQSYTANSNTTTIDTSVANFIEVNLDAGIETEIVLEKESISQTNLLKVVPDLVPGAWDLSIAVYEDGKLKPVNSQDTSPYSLSFKPDGTKMYMMGLSSDTVYQYALSTPWEVQTAVYETGKLKSVSAQDLQPYDIFFKPDGTKMYIMGLNNKTIYQYALSTPWDVSSADYETGKLILVNSQDTGPVGLFFKPDGTKMYMIGYTNDNVYQYALSTPWEVQTAVYETGKIKNVAAEEANPHGLSFKSDGTKMYIVGNATDTVYQYALSTPWEVQTAVYEPGKLKSVAAQDTNPLDISFKPDGTKMYIMGVTNDSIFEYILLTPWDVSSAIYVAGKFKSVASEEGSPTAIFFKPDGTKMYMMGTNTDTVYQYNTLITTQDTIANVIWPETIEWEDGVAPNLPKLSETALIEIEARTDYRGTNYTGRLVGRNF